MHPAFDLPGLLLRAAFTYVLLQILLRAAGKRTISEGTPFDFVLSIILGDLFDDIFYAEVSAAQFVTAAVTLIVLDVLTSWLCRLSPAADRILSTGAVLFLRDGEIFRPGARAERLHEQEAAMLLRRGGGIERARWDEVHAAHVEEGGEVSVVWREEARPLQRRDVSRGDIATKS